MLSQAKWLGLSLALHLVAAGCLILWVSRAVERTPETIMVQLANCVPAEGGLRKVSHVPRPLAARPAVSAGPADRSRPGLQRQALQPAAPQVLTTTAGAEQSQVRDPPTPSAVIAPASITNRRGEDLVSDPRPLAKTIVPHAAPVAEGRPAQEAARQHYLRENYAYIRDLVTKQLAYPPLARKMRWSGKVVIAFIIAEDGSVHTIRVVESSGFPLLDKSATETVRAAAPFPKPPASAEIVLPVSFTLM
ncbi:MAG: TonB family protein [Geobacteraceae bacterium]|nr:TonB family protein [Geobacteraceae bacterium]